MRILKKLYLIFIFTFLTAFNLTAETQISKDIKKAFSSYAGLKELKKRGFTLKSIESANSIEDVYNTLLPYMIKDGIPLDNAIQFYDKLNYQQYNFKQHYSLHFTNDYGTKNELLDKGYSENQIFPYFSKGNDIYRVGKFVWEKAKNFPETGSWMMPQFPPINGNNFIYFWYPFYTDQFYPEYWEQASSKDFIIIDFRLNNNGDYPIKLFLDYLEKVKYQGKLIIIMDSSSNTAEWLLSYRMTKWVNGQEIQRNLSYTTIGENTLGTGNFSGQWNRYENDRNVIWGIRKETNQWKKVEEGIGIMPDIWAETPEDIFKTVEKITGIQDFYKIVQPYQNFIDNLFVKNVNNFHFINLPLNFSKIDNSNFIYLISEYVKAENNWLDFCFENKDKISRISTRQLEHLMANSQNLSVDEYIAQLNDAVDISITKNIIELEKIKGDDFLNLLASKLEFNEDVKEENRYLESIFLVYNKYDVLQKEGFDIHKMDYMTKPEEIINYLQEFFLSKEGYPRDLHTDFSIKTNNNQFYSIKQTSRYIAFNDEYGSKEQLKKKGLIEDKTMFYYPYHDGKFWNGKNDWRTGKQIMAFENYNYQQTEWALSYYTTEKSVYFKFRNFPHPMNNGPELQDSELEEMIQKLSKEKGKENVIFDITKNTGGDGFTSDRISKAVKEAGIKNVYIVMDKGAFSCGDHFPLESKNLFFKEQNVTLVGYPTKGGTGSGDQETYVINFPDFQITADIATLYVESETEHEGWGATPDIYADNLTDALGAIRTLTGDNDIKPFETDQRKENNKGKLRWNKNDTIYEIN